MKSLIAGLIFLFVSVTRTAYAEVIDIDAAQLQELLNQKAVVIDVRRVDEWTNSGIINNSILLTFFDQHGRYDSKKWLNEVSSRVETNDVMVLICHQGVRSKLIADWLDNSTEYSKIYNVAEGIRGWIAQGYPVVDSQ